MSEEMLIAVMAAIAAVVGPLLALLLKDWLAQRRQLRTQRAEARKTTRTLRARSISARARAKRIERENRVLRRDLQRARMAMWALEEEADHS